MHYSLPLLAALSLAPLSAVASPIMMLNPSVSTSSNGMTSTYNNVTTITFNGSQVLPAGFSGGAVVNGSSSAAYAAPAGDSSNYFIAGAGPTYTGSATFTPGGMYNYFGFYWGSIDAYNSIAFLLNGSQVASFTGLQAPPANGNQVAGDTNEFVDFLFPTAGYNSVVFSTSNANFELDNVAYGNVNPAVAATPEPSSIALLGTGLLGLAGMVKRRYLVRAGY